MKVRRSLRRPAAFPRSRKRGTYISERWPYDIISQEKKYSTAAALIVLFGLAEVLIVWGFVVFVAAPFAFELVSRGFEALPTFSSYE